MSAKFLIRPANFEDINTVCQLIAEQNIEDYGEPFITTDGLKRLWFSPGFNLQTDTLLAFSTEGKPAAYMDIQDKTDLSIYIAKGFREIETANHLFDLLEKQALAQQPKSLYGRVSEKNKILKETFISKGFQSKLSFLIMEILMDEPPQDSMWPEKITVRNFIPQQDEQATYQTDEEASKDKGYHSPLTFEEWKKRMDMDEKSFDPRLWFLACKDNQVVGVALNAFAIETNTGWVDHLSVRREWRGKGIGKALLLHTLHEFYQKGIRRIKLSVDSKSLTNAPRLYESVGMRIIQQYHIFKKELE
jgi:GNAT superfamily N-acetyltransferase